MKRRRTLGLVVAWLVVVAAAAAVAWIVLGVAIGQVIPVAAASSTRSGGSIRSDGSIRNDVLTRSDGLPTERSAPVDVQRVSVVLGTQGQVLIACAPTRLANWSVLPAPGWAAGVTGESPNGIRVEFIRSGKLSVVTAWCESGHPRFWRGPGERTGKPLWSATDG